MMKESTLIDSDNESLGVACFQQSQMNPPKPSELPHIVFIEFVEAASRLSLKAIESYGYYVCSLFFLSYSNCCLLLSLDVFLASSGLTEAKRIRMAFNMITELSGLNSEAK
jgi:hypothetical protein